MIQARKRVFALSIYDPENKLNWDKNIKDNLNEVLSNQFNSEYKPLWIQTKNNVFDFNNKDLHESLWAQIKNTPSRIRMIEGGKDINLKSLVKIPTVTTKQDRLPNVGSLDFINDRKDSKGVSYTNKRFITPREAYLLMGFTKQYYSRAKKEMLTISKLSGARTDSGAREKLYKQAGNSIAVNVLEEVFYYVNKF